MWITFDAVGALMCTYVCFMFICLVLKAAWVRASSPEGHGWRVIQLGDFTMQWFFHFITGEQVLDNFRTQFIDEMDAASVVRTLEHEGIISDGVLQEVKTANGRMNQNAILHAHLKATCTEDSLMTTCHKIIAVTGNPRMKALGEDMLSMLEGESGTRMSLDACSSGTVCTCDPELNTRSSG